MRNRLATRRRLLAAAGGTTILLIAGCLDLGGGSNGNSLVEDVPTPGPGPNREIAASQFVLTFSATPDSEWIEPYTRSRGPYAEEPRLALLQPLVETPEGDRAGVHPETGEIIQEVEASSVQGAGFSRSVRIFGQTRLDVSISAQALLRTIRAHGHEPETVQCDLEVTVEIEPYVERSEETGLSPPTAGREDSPSAPLHRRWSRETTASQSSGSI